MHFFLQIITFFGYLGVYNTLFKNKRNKKFLEFLNEYRVCETSLINGLKRISKWLRWEPHDLKAVVDWVPWSRKVNESANVIDSVMVVELSHHACPVSESKLD